MAKTDTVPGAETAGNLQTSWPFPRPGDTSAPGSETAQNVDGKGRAVLAVDVKVVVNASVSAHLKKWSGKKGVITDRVGDGAWMVMMNGRNFLQSFHHTELDAIDAGIASAAAAPADPPAERIRVEAINLYTDPAKNVVQRLPLEQLQESPFNPRKRFDEKALADLADTIRGVGVMQPILARPISLGSVEIRSTDGPLQPLEIVFGHRRFRAAKLAGETHVPVIVRELTDAQSRQMQAIENVQRKDVDPLDEAEGYANYIQVHGVSKDQLAAEIGLSRTQVYSRLKLLNAVPAVREALQAKEIDAEVALYLSRIPHAKLQEKALASLRSNGHQITDGGKASVRNIREFLRERFTLRLSGAIFDRKDELLLPAAGSCTACPKRSGNSPEHEDLTETRKGQSRWGQAITDRGEPELCTDPDCFEAKKKAHLGQRAAALIDKGKTVITGGKARSAVSADGEVKNGFIALKDVRDAIKKAATKPETVVIQDPRGGKLFDAVSLDALQAAGIKIKGAAAKKQGGESRWEAENRRYEQQRAREAAKAAARTRVNVAILEAVRKAAGALPRTAFELQLVAATAVAGVDWEAREMLAGLHGFKGFEQLQKKIGQMPVEQIALLLLDCALIRGVHDRGYRDEKPEALLQVAKQYGVDVKAIEAAVAKLPVDDKTKDLLQEGAEEEEQIEEAEA